MGLLIAASRPQKRAKTESSTHITGKHVEESCEVEAGNRNCGSRVCLGAGEGGKRTAGRRKKTEK